MKLSVVVPCYNEEGNIPLFYEATVAALKDLMQDTELIFINDGSKDGTAAALSKLVDTSPYKVRAVTFSRNFGKEAALLAGLRESVGDYTVIIDADMQQRPEYIYEMYKILESQPEYDIVAAYQDVRKEGKVLSLFKNAFYKIINSLSDVEFVQSASDFRMFRRPVVEAMLSLSERCRFTKGIFAWVGFNTYYMPYKVEERATGKSNWNFFKLLSYAIDGIMAFSVKPLLLVSILGIIVFLISIVCTIYVVIKTLIFGDPVAGFPTLVCLIMMLAGIQLLSMGILGRYLAKNYTETKARPSYIVKEVRRTEDNQ